VNDREEVLLGKDEATKDPGRTRERTVYRLTEQGLDALCVYTGTPARFTPLKSEPLLRLLIADLVGERLTSRGWQRCAGTSTTCSRGWTKPRRAPRRFRTDARTFFSSRASSAAYSNCTSSLSTRSSANWARARDQTFAELARTAEATRP
jgi:hypothetical protein